MRRIFGVALVVVVLGGACGDDDDQAQHPTPAATVTAVAEPSATQMPDATVPTSTEAPEPSGDDEGSALGPLSLTPAQLEELFPSPELVAELIGAAEIDEEFGGFGVAGDVPPSAAQVQRTFWSLDSGDRSMGVEPVDFVVVQLVLVKNDVDVQPVLDSVVAFDATYWAWLPIEIAGAATALESEWIPYEGEPDDEPEFNAVLASRDRLIVIVTTAGSDSDATDRAAASIAEAALELVGQFTAQ